MEQPSAAACASIQEQHQRVDESNGNATRTRTTTTTTMGRTGRRRRNRQQVTPVTTSTAATTKSSDDDTNNPGLQRQIIQPTALEPSLSMFENGNALIGDGMGGETVAPIGRNNHRANTIASSDDTAVRLTPQPPDQFRIRRSAARMLNEEEIIATSRSRQNNNIKPGAFPERGRPVGLHQNQIQNYVHRPTTTNNQQNQNRQRTRNRTDQEDQIQLLGLSDRLSSRAFSRMVRTQEDVPVAKALLIRRPSLHRQDEYRDGLRCSSGSSTAGSRVSSQRQQQPPPMRTFQRHNSVPTNMVPPMMMTTVDEEVSTTTSVLDRPGLIRQNRTRGLRCSGSSSAEGANIIYHRRSSSDPTELLLMDASVRLASMTAFTRYGSNIATEQEDLTFDAIPPELRPNAAAAAPREARLPSLIPSINVQRLDSVVSNNNTPLERFFERITHQHH